MNNKLALFFSLFIVFVYSCDRVDNDPNGDELARLNAWIKARGLENYKLPSGMYYIGEREGTGAAVKDSDIVLYSYVLKNLDGDILSNTYKDTAIYYEYEVVKPTTHYAPLVDVYRDSKKKYGFYEGLSRMKEGGKATLIVPSSMSHVGRHSYNSLIFEVELNKVFDGNSKEFERALIDEYIARTDTGVFDFVNMDTAYIKNVYKIEVKSDKPNKFDTVSVNYTGFFLDDFILGTNIKSVALKNNTFKLGFEYTPLKFVVGNQNPFFTGFEFAIKQMSLQQKVICIFPSKYAYGMRGSSDGDTEIPANTPLVFQLELVKIGRYIKPSK